MAKQMDKINNVLDTITIVLSLIAGVSLIVAGLAAEGETEAERVAIIKQTAETLSRMTEERAVPIPVMPEKIDYAALIKTAGASLAGVPVGLNDKTLTPAVINLYQTPNLLITDDTRTEKNKILKLMLHTLCKAYAPEQLQLIVIDSSAMLLYEFSRYDHAVYINEETDQSEFAEWLRGEIRIRKQTVIDIIKTNNGFTQKNIPFRHLLIAVDNLSEFGANGGDALKDVIQSIVRRERNINISVIAAGNLNDLTGDWEDVAKAFKEQQCALLLGSIKDQDLFDIRMPYTFQEKQMQEGDGYLIYKNKVTGIKFALE
jgi:S-DNA-T family DNA segregation ATPase FtsK/SpoIIIE